MVERLNNISLENFKNLNNNMTKTRENNSNYVISLGRRGKGEATLKIGKTITLYNQGKISQLQTAENIINKLITAKTEKEQKSAFKKYDKIVDKYKANEPLNKRLEEAKTIKPFIINVILYKEFKPLEDETDEEFKQRKRRAKLHKGVYEQIGILSLNVKGEEKVLKGVLEKMLERDNIIGSNDTSELFKKWKTF